MSVRSVCARGVSWHSSASGTDLACCPITMGTTLDYPCKIKSPPCDAPASPLHNCLTHALALKTDGLSLPLAYTCRASSVCISVGQWSVCSSFSTTTSLARTYALWSPQEKDKQELCPFQQTNDYTFSVPSGIIPYWEVLNLTPLKPNNLQASLTLAH